MTLLFVYKVNYEGFDFRFYQGIKTSVLKSIGYYFQKLSASSYNCSANPMHLTDFKPLKSDLTEIFMYTISKSDSGYSLPT